MPCVISLIYSSPFISIDHFILRQSGFYNNPLKFSEPKKKRFAPWCSVMSFFSPEKLAEFHEIAIYLLRCLELSVTSYL